MLTPVVTYSFEGGSIFSKFTDKGEKNVSRYFEECIRDKRFYGLFAASFIMVGVCATFLFHIGRINVASRKSTLVETYVNLSWLCDVFARLVGGLLACFLRESVNEYIFGIVGTILGLFGFILCAFNLLYFGTMFVSLALGLWWVIPALILMDEGGPKSIGGLWGTILSFNFYGIFVFSFIFELMWENIAKPLTPIYITFMISCALATGAIYYSYNKDVHPQKR